MTKPLESIYKSDSVKKLEKLKDKQFEIDNTKDKKNIKKTPTKKITSDFHNSTG